MLARLFVFFGSLLVLALCAALIGPYFVDWSSYREDFEREASAILGRRVEVMGEASARILPFPSVSFSDVVVAGSDGRPDMTAESFSMDAELAPFLSGEVLIFDMRLVRPKAEVTVGQDGVVDWALSPSAPVDPGHVTIENLTVVEGQLVVVDAASGRQLAINEINSDVSARSLKGPWRATGSLRVNGRRTALSATTGVSDGSGAMSLKLSASPEVFPVKLDSDGRVVNDNGALRYSGTFRAVGVPPVQSQLRDGDGKTARPEAQAARNRATGTFHLTSSRLDLDTFRFEAGPIADPYSAEGTAFLDLGKDPRFLIEATGQQFEVEEDENGAAGGKTLGERLADIEDTLAMVPEPTIPGSVNIKLPAVVAGTTTLRELNLSARPEGAGWRILSASAQLPGRSTLEADGFLVGGDAPHFEGNLLLAVKQPTGFAAWLSKDIESAVRALPAAGFRSAVSIDREKQTFSAMELILGPTKLTGAVERTSVPGAKPVIVARLAGDTVDADTAAAFAAMLGEGTVREHDLDLALKAGSVSVAGIDVRNLDAAARLAGDRLDLDRLSIGDLAGASIAATGSARDLTAQPIGDIDMTLTSADLATLAEQLARWRPGSMLARELAERAAANPGLLADGRIDVVGSLSSASAADLPSQMALSVSGTVGGSTMQGSVSGHTADTSGDEALEMQIEVANPEATPLLALAGLPTLPVISLGPGKLNVSARRGATEMFATSAALEGQGFRLGFEGDAGQTVADTPAFTARGKLALKAEDIEPWLLAVGTPAPGMGFGTAAELQADADFSENLLVLSELDGTVGASSVGGDVNVDFAKGRPDISGALALDTLDLEPLAASLFGAPALASDDGLSWPSTQFVAKTATPVTADLQLNVGTLATGILPALHEASLSLKATETQLLASSIAGNSVGGAVTGTVELSNESGNGLVSGQLAVKDADLAVLLPEAGIAAPGLTGRADISGSIAAGGRSIEALIAGLSGSGVVNLRNLQVAGLNAGALPALLKEADGLGQGIDDAATTRFAPPILQTGDFAAGDRNFAFSVASGVVRMPPARFDREQAVLTGEGRIDLNAQTVDAVADFALKPGDDALVGSEPTVQLTVSGPVNAPQLALDTAGLAQFLTQRQLEIEQARVEAMQAAILEKQRLRREVVRTVALYAYRAAVNATEAGRKVELARLQTEADERRRLEEEAKAKAKAEKAKAEEEAKQPTVQPEPAPKPDASVAPPRRAQPANAPVGAFPPPPPAPADFGDSDFDG